MATLLVMALWHTPLAYAQLEPQAPRGFASPEAAVQALVAAAQAGDRAHILAVLGPGGEQVVYSGDEVADQRGHSVFLRSVGEAIWVVRETPERAIAYLGQERWRFPVPLVKEADGWHFDAGAGKAEVLKNRAERNELNAVEVLLAYIDAQKEYAAIDRDGDGVREYAQKLWSTPGKRDGLFWESEAPADRSPLGPLVAQARAEGYPRGDQKVGPRPYHGYVFRILTRQGEHATGGAKDYGVQGNMTAGFAAIAFPAEYGTSGVMTFIINDRGELYQKDLGQDEAAWSIMEYNPDETWSRLR
jgi:hypothetical protein